MAAVEGSWKRRLEGRWCFLSTEETLITDDICIIYSNDAQKQTGNQKLECGNQAITRSAGGQIQIIRIRIRRGRRRRAPGKVQHRRKSNEGDRVHQELCPILGELHQRTLEATDVQRLRRHSHEGHYLQKLGFVTLHDLIDVITALKM